jgi:xylose dehydrogenase (NAD/NADP)
MLNWGFLGTARINLKILTFLTPKAIASRTLEKAKAYAAEHQIEKYFGSYEELIKATDIDAIYISLPNDQHFHWTKLALENGKHVLCEKPLAPTAEETRILAETARKNNRIMMEGFMYRHHRQIKELKNLVETKAIGDIQHVRSTFHFTMKPGPNIRMNTANHGGVLLDLGCYIVDLTNHLFNGPPLNVKAQAKLKDEVDVASAGLMNYGQGKSASFDCSFESLRRDFIEVVGTDGVIQLDHPFKGTAQADLKIISESGTQTLEVGDPVDIYQKQFENFAGAVYGKCKPVVTLEESVATAQTLEMLKRCLFTR